MVFNANLSQIFSQDVSEFMGRESVMHIFDHDEPTNLLDQGMLLNELDDLLNEAFIQDSQISLRLGDSDDRVLSNQTTFQTQNSILPSLMSLTLEN